jgi:hypothetical protein
MKYIESLRDWLIEKPLRVDVAAIITLTLLWALYFWRVLTPNPANQVSLPQGDFSGQFLAFGSYQARRLLAGEIPLWNPYNYAGHPFVADTQAAVFYPLRLITIFISHWFFSGWSYSALQLEALAHYWLASVFMYLFVRNLTASSIAGVVSALTFTYGGYLTGYPPLQLAVLEAGIWLPLTLLGASRALEENCTFRQGALWLSLSAGALGLSLLAGHPQTSLFSIYLLSAYIVYSSHQNHHGWLRAIATVIFVIGLGFALGAVQVLPGLEYTRLTTRSGFGFDQLAGGFPFSDLITLILPNVLSTWSPLYSGIGALILAMTGMWSGVKSARFWVMVAGGALLVSFGGSTIAYQLAYLFAPGFSMFRGQERAAFVIAVCIAILAGIGTASIMRGHVSREIITRLTQRVLIALTVLALVLFIAERTVPGEQTYAALRWGMFVALIAALAWGVLGYGSRLAQSALWPAALISLIVFDIFSVTIHTNWQPIPASERQLLTDLIPAVIDDPTLFRVDGRLGLGENYGTMIGVQDIRGTSPLRLASLDAYLAFPDQTRIYQLLAVKYVFTDWEELAVPTRIRASIEHKGQTWLLHEIEQLYPRAWMTYAVMDTFDRAQALGWLADPSFDPARTVILEHQPDLTLPPNPPDKATVDVVSYQPERLELQVDTPAEGVLVISELHYPGWVAQVDGVNVPILVADGALRALPLKEGEHNVVMRYEPLSFKIGAAVSVAALISVIGIIVSSAVFAVRRKGFQ